MANSGARPWDIGEWLRGVGLGQYEASFRRNEVNERVLPKLTQEDLKEEASPDRASSLERRPYRAALQQLIIP
jgi:hypothetical protein